jgi:hypothetical protein
MGTFQITLGIIWCIFAIGLFIWTKSWVAFGIHFAIGLGLILFDGEEDKVEQRKDINKTKKKK